MTVPKKAKAKEAQTYRKRMQQRLCRHYQRGTLLTKKYSFQVNNQDHTATETAPIRRKIQHILLAGCKHIRDNDFIDHLRCPGQNETPASAMLARAPYNLYYGADVAGSAQSIDGIETVERFTYASGSRRKSIGIDPVTFTLNPLPQFFYDLKEAAKDIIGLPDIFKHADYNAMSAEGYWDTNCTGWQTDICLKEKDKCSDTPVLIFTFGGTKQLLFARGKTDKDVYVHHTQVAIEQNDNCCVGLHPADEHWTQWAACELLKWFHKSECPKGLDGMIWTFVLHVVDSTARVNASTGSTVNPGPQPIFDALRDTYQTEPGYAERIGAIRAKMNKLCEKTIG